MRGAIRLSVALIVLVGIILPIAQQSADAMSLRQLQQKLQSTSHSMAQVRSQLRSTKKRQQTAIHELGAAQNRLSVHRARLLSYRQQLRSVRVALDRAHADLRIVEDRLKRRNNLLSDRLVDTYKHGSVSYASVLLGSGDVYDLLSRGYVVRRILRSDMELVDSIRKDKATVEKYRAFLQRKERERAALEAQQASVTLASANDSRRKQELLNSIERDRAAYEQALAEFQRASSSLEAKIRAMQRTPAGQKRVANPWRGGYICPLSCKYRITSRFGWRIHPIHRTRSFHTGIDLAAPTGSPIRAAAGGTVIISANYGAYGRHVVIDHGGRISTLYGHCSRVRVSVGQSVKQGQIIANVGTTGWSTGPHLHYEKRKNGTAINPM